MKEVNSYGWKAVIGSSIGYAMDGFDLLILGFMLTLISGDLGLSYFLPYLQVFVPLLKAIGIFLFTVQSLVLV